MSPRIEDEVYRREIDELTAGDSVCPSSALRELFEIAGDEIICTRGAFRKSVGLRGADNSGRRDEATMEKHLWMSCFQSRPHPV
jgi:hypothetical protein